jgi:hypothetical protein
VSTKYIICWKVKKLIAKGRVISGILIFEFAKLFIFSKINAVYLKYANKHKLNAIPKIKYNMLFEFLV